MRTRKLNNPNTFGGYHDTMERPRVLETDRPGLVWLLALPFTHTTRGYDSNSVSLNYKIELISRL